jgi:hypothetical protein
MMSPRGFIFYQGPSVLDGKPIVVIVTMVTRNFKTGHMIQVWIMRSDINPVEASQLGEDISICGNCVHRHYNDGSCYVNIGQAPNQIFKGFNRNLYPFFDPSEHSKYFNGRKVRLGAYGDPAAAPFEVMQSIVNLCTGHTAYTHQIKHKNFDKRYLELCMVSADSPKQAQRYQLLLGAKTFRVSVIGDELLDDELECLNESDNIQCIDCGLCDGTQRNIKINVHGSLASRFKTAKV